MEVFRFSRGGLEGPQAFTVEIDDDAQPMDGRIRAALEQLAPEGSQSAQRFMEELAMLKRWYYRSVKTGELFLADSNGELPMRRIVRGVSRVFRGEKPAGDLSETAGDYWRFRAGEAGVRAGSAGVGCSVPLP